MRKKNYFVGALFIMAGVVSPSVLAEAGQGGQYQFPETNNAVSHQGATLQQQPGYAYPQAMAQNYRQPMYYGYPAAAYYYPRAMQGQPMTVVPYVYPQGYQNPQRVYPGMQPQQGAPVMAQTPQALPANQYRSPYNPNIAATPGPKPPPPPEPKKVVKPWGDTRYIWPDFYTDFTGDFWDEMINAPYQMGYMPGGWRFPSLSSPDPVTVGDAVANQVPPILDESANFINFAD